ncbi:MAG: hypothetical protein ABI615_13810 [Chthoniobacterales bacterium]
MKKLILPALLLVAATCAFAQSNTPAPAPLKKLPLNGFVTLKEITDDFTNSPDAAQKKYVGRRIIVFGRVGKISSGSGNNVLVVYLQRRNHSTPDVKGKVTMDALPANTSVGVSDDGTQAMLMHRGPRTQEIRRDNILIAIDENIALKGSCTGNVAGDIILEDVKLIRHKKADALARKAGIQ